MCIYTLFPAASWRLQQICFIGSILPNSSNSLGSSLGMFPMHQLRNVQPVNNTAKEIVLRFKDKHVINPLISSLLEFVLTM